MLAIITLLGVAFIPIASSPQYSIDLLTDIFLKTAFEGGRHQRRVAKIEIEAR